LTFVIVYTVWTLQPIPIASYLTRIRILILGPSSLLGILVPMTLFSSSELSFLVVSQIYYWARILSIIFNIGGYFLLVYRLNHVLKYTVASAGSTSASASAGSTPKSQYSTSPPRAGNPLAALVRRFKYYPIIQVLSRICVAYYEEVYGHDYEYHSSFTLEKKIATLLYLITLPSAGLGFFVVFLVVSPGAVKLLQDDWTWLMTRVCGEVCYNRFRRRLSSTYQDGDPLPPAVTGLSPPEGFGREEGSEGEGRGSSGRQSWYESNRSQSVGRGGGREAARGGGRFDHLDEDELSSEITRMYSTSSSGLRHYSLSGSYGSKGERDSEHQPKRGTLIAESLLSATDV
jgi:hypothetical protein